MTLLINRSPRLFSLAEYQRLAEVGVLGPQERVELIGGEIVPMSPQDPRHSESVTWCTHAFSQAFGQTHLVRVQLPLQVGEHSLPEPDLVLLPLQRAKSFEGRHPNRVDFVLEVANSSLRYDRGEKLRLYAEAKIPEYWIVNLRNNWIEVYRDPQGYSFGDRFRRGPGSELALMHFPNHLLSVSTLLALEP